MTLLDSIQLPEGIVDLSIDELYTLADELREFLIESVVKTGGHLSSSLGVIELTIALHHTFKTPTDKIVWDVGHQSYPYKILTGRKDQMSSLRKYKGLSGFSKRSESPHDSFGTGHSSTSISAAIGMAYGMQRNRTGGQAIAVIGDGALTGGMAFEALNHAGDSEANLIVILNDNEMSISVNVGAMSRYLTRILSSRPYNSMRENSRKILSKMPKAFSLAQKAEGHIKGMVMARTVFEELGFNYLGPIDGHDITALVRTLKVIKKFKGPQFLHVITKKGKGYPEAENNPTAYHGVSPKTSATLTKTKINTYTKVFSDWICKKAADNTKIVAITPAMREGSGLVEFSNLFPRRFIDVGIAEQHALTFAAGMSCEGMIPIVAIYSTFLQRAYDQLIHDIALQNLHVIFAIDRAGLVGEDGPTHAGTFDLSFLRCIPNLIIMAPAYQQEMEQMLDLAVITAVPVAIRYPRGNVHKITPSNNKVKLGSADIVQTGTLACIFVFGSMLSNVLEAVKGLDITVVNMRFIKPLDTKLLDDMTKKFKTLFSIEENSIQGGAGSAIQEYINRQIHILGIPDEFIEHGATDKLIASINLDPEGIKKQILQKISH